MREEALRRLLRPLSASTKLSGSCTRGQAFFAAEWARRVEASFRNLVAEAVQGLPLPALLRYDADRCERQALRERCAELEAQNARMAQVRGGDQAFRAGSVG